MYDSISSNLWRRLRRRWAVLLGGAVVGALLGLAFANAGSGNETARFNFRFASLADAAGVLKLDRVTDVDVTTIASQARLDYDLTPAGERLATTFSANKGANTVSVTVRGASRDEVLAAADQLEQTMVELAVTPRVAQTELAVSTVDSDITAIRQQISDIDAAVDQLSPDDVSRPALLLQRIEADRDLADATSRRSSVVALGHYISDSLITRSAVSFGEAPSNFAPLVVGAAVMVILVVVAFLVMVLTDRKVRRRMHLEDAAPEATVLGVLARLSALSDGERAGLVTASREFARRHGVARLVLSDAGRGGTPSELGSVLAPLAGEVEVIVSDLPAASAPALLSSAGSGCIVVVRWGKTTQDQLSSAFASIRSAGSPAVGLVLEGVPRSELDWAGVSAHGRMNEMAA